MQQQRQDSYYGWEQLRSEQSGSSKQLLNNSSSPFGSKHNNDSGSKHFQESKHSESQQQFRCVRRPPIRRADYGRDSNSGSSRSQSHTPSPPREYSHGVQHHNEWQDLHRALAASEQQQQPYPEEDHRHWESMPHLRYEDYHYPSEDRRRWQEEEEEQRRWEEERRHRAEMRRKWHEAEQLKWEQEQQSLRRQQWLLQQQKEAEEEERLRQERLEEERHRRVREEEEQRRWEAEQIEELRRYEELQQRRKEEEQERKKEEERKRQQERYLKEEEKNSYQQRVAELVRPSAIPKPPTPPAEFEDSHAVDQWDPATAQLLVELEEKNFASLSSSPSSADKLSRHSAMSKISWEPPYAFASSDHSSERTKPLHLCKTSRHSSEGSCHWGKCASLKKSPASSTTTELRKSPPPTAGLKSGSSHHSRSSGKVGAYHEDPRVGAFAEQPVAEANRMMVEIQPGFSLPLRGSQETLQAVSEGRILEAFCLSCSCHLIVKDDCDFVICPACRVVSPVEGGVGTMDYVGLGMHKSAHDAAAANCHYY